MKFRKGFVTNSSSSSFIIAKKDEVDTIRLGYEILSKKALDDMLEYSSYYNFSTQVNDFIAKGDMEKAKEQLAFDITQDLINKNIDLELDSWKVTGGESSNETEDPTEMFIYLVNKLILDDFKIIATYN